MFITQNLDNGNFTAEQLESLITRVFASVMEKFDACIGLNKMLDKFEGRLVKINDLESAFLKGWVSFSLFSGIEGNVPHQP